MGHASPLYATINSAEGLTLPPSNCAFDYKNMDCVPSTSKGEYVTL